MKKTVETMASAMRGFKKAMDDFDLAMADANDVFRSFSRVAPLPARWYYKIPFIGKKIHYRDITNWLSSSNYRIDTTVTRDGKRLDIILPVDELTARVHGLREGPEK
jgi:hypothetical protein